MAHGKTGRALRYAYLDSDNTLSSKLPSPVVPNVFLSDLVYEQLKKHPANRVILQSASDGKTVTAGQMVAMTPNIAETLKSFGLVEGDVVFAISGDSLSLSCLLLPLAALGIIYVAERPSSSIAELTHRARHSGAKAVLCDVQTVGRAMIAVAVLQSVQFIIALGEQDSDGKPTSKPVKLLSLTDARTASPVLDELPSPRQKPDDAVAYITYSSGSTGSPKGFLKSHQNLVAVLTGYEAGSDFYASSGDVFYSDTPPVHEVDITLLLSAMYHGYTVVLAECFDIERFVVYVPRYGITHALLSAPETTVLANNCPPPSQVPSLKCIVSVGSTLSEATAKTLTAMRSQLRIIHDYGMTECGQICSVPEDCPNFRTVGAPHRGNAIRIVCIELSQSLGPYRPGEIYVSTPQIMNYYLSDPEANARNFTSDGWIKTGDLGYFDEEGLVYIVDRIKDVIKCNGEQVSPTHLESLLLAQDEIAEAAVVGVPDDIDGEVPWAFVVLKSKEMHDGANDILNHTNAQLSPNDRIRKLISLQELPRTGIGKIDRKTLRPSYDQDH